MVTNPQIGETHVDGRLVHGTNLLDDSEWTTSADTVVLLMGKLPDDELYRHPRGRIDQPSPSRRLRGSLADHRRGL